MADMEEIKYAIGILKSEKSVQNNITLLHCTSEYPAPVEDINLRCMQSMRDCFGIDIGLSDHTKGIHIAIAAVALGAKMIEKHITLDKNMDGPDHLASINPEELNALVSSLRDVEKSLGDDKKMSRESELKNKAIARKSIVANRDISVGERFTEENITTKRPGDGLSPIYWDKVIGLTADRPYKIDEKIELK